MMPDVIKIFSLFLLAGAVAQNDKNLTGVSLTLKDTDSPIGIFDKYVALLDQEESGIGLADIDSYEPCGTKRIIRKSVRSEEEMVQSAIKLVTNETEREGKHKNSIDEQKKTIHVYFYVFNTTTGDVSENQLERQMKVLNKSFGGKSNNFYPSCDGGEKEKSLETRFTFHRKGTRFFKDKYKFVKTLDKGFEKTSRAELFEMVENAFGVDFISTYNITALSNVEIVRDFLIPNAQYDVFQTFLGKVYGHEDCGVLSVFVLPNILMERVLGIARFPWDCAVADSVNLYTDNVLLNRIALPDSSTQAGARATIPYEEGIVLVHEVGHWLGLAHTFQGTFEGTGFKTGCYEMGGDNIADTPAQSTPSRGCPVRKDTCPEQDGFDPIHNFMDYSDDCCSTTFTGQQDRKMWYSWKAFRKQ